MYKLSGPAVKGLKHVLIRRVKGLTSGVTWEILTWLALNIISGDTWEILTWSALNIASGDTWEILKNWEMMSHIYLERGKITLTDNEIKLITSLKPRITQTMTRQVYRRQKCCLINRPFCGGVVQARVGVDYNWWLRLRLWLHVIFIYRLRLWLWLFVIIFINYDYDYDYMSLKIIDYDYDYTLFFRLRLWLWLQ